MNGFHRGIRIDSPKRLIIPCLALLTLFPSITALGGGDDKKNPGGSSAGLRKKDSAWDPMELRSYIDDLRKELKQDDDPETQASALSRLFGHSPTGHGFIPPPDVKKMLVERKLDYKNWQCRRIAAHAFQYLLQYEPETLIPILRDGLNDPQPEVRKQSVASFEHLMLFVLPKPPLFKPHNRETREKIEKHRDEHVDQIVDLVLSKALQDEETAAAAIGIMQSKSLEPNGVRLRSLEHALKAPSLHPYRRKELEKVKNQWRRKLAKDDAPANGGDDATKDKQFKDR